MSHASDTSPVVLGGNSKLTLLDAIAQSVGFMGPVFSMALLVPLVVGLISATGNGAGTAAPLAVLLAAVGVLGFGWIIAQYAKKIAAAGSLYDYISDGFGPRVGAAFGFLYYVGIIGLGAALLVVLGGTIHDTLAGEFGNALFPEFVWDLLLLALLAVVLYVGVAVSTRAQLVLALLSIATVLLFSLYVIIKVGGKNDFGQALVPAANMDAWRGVLFGVLYGVLLFTGFETAANLGEETAHPKRDIPRAILISVLMIAGFYLIATYAQVAGYGFNLDNMGKAIQAGPLTTLAGPDSGFGSEGMRRLIELMIVLDMLAVLIGVAVAAARGVFALARDGRLPTALGRVSLRGTPMTAAALVLVIDFLVILATVSNETFLQQYGQDGAPLFPHYFAVFAWLSALGGLALAVIYLVICVGALRGLADHPNRMGVYVASAVGILVTGAAIFGTIYGVVAPTIYAVWTAVAVLAIGFVLAWVFPGHQRPADPWQGLSPAEHGPTRL